MKKGEILFDLRKLKIGESLKIYSSSLDIFLNEKVDIYLISKKEDGLYVSYTKKDGFQEGEEIKFDKKICFLNNFFAKENTYIGEYIIRKGAPFIGKYEDQIEFSFPNIIQAAQ